MLDPRKLQLLVNVAVTSSIAGAAERAGISASAASQQLAALERQLDVILLERSARSVRLTSAGRTLVEHATRALAELAAADEAVRTEAGLQGGTLRLAAFASSGPHLTIPALSAFHRHYPAVVVSFVELEPEDAIPAVAAGDLHLAVTHQYRHLPRPNLRGLSQTMLRRDRLLLAAPAHLSPASTKPVGLPSFADATWISTKPATGFQAITEHACRASGFEPNVAYRADDYELVLSLVAADLGVALVPELLAIHRPGITYLELSHPDGLARDVHATSRTGDPSSAVQEMIRCLRKVDRTKRR